MPPVLAKALLSIVLDPESIKKVLLILLLFIFFLLFLMTPAALLLRIPFSGPVENQMYSEICEDLNARMENHREDLGENEEVLPWQPLEYKYLVAIDGVKHNQDFNKVTRSSIESLANEFTVLVFDHTERRSRTYTDEEGNEHTVYYYVDIYRYSTFDDVLNRLGFSDEEKELAYVYSEFDISELENVDQFSPELEELINETDLLWPLPGYTRISSRHGPRIHPVTGKNSFHHGIDLPAPTGTPVYSPEDGTVIRKHYSTYEGKRLVIKHTNGLQTIYCHLSSYAVSEGDTVRKGQLIAKVGNTGIFTTGSHLHFETHLSGKEYNPLSFYK